MVQGYQRRMITTVLFFALFIAACNRESAKTNATSAILSAQQSFELIQKNQTNPDFMILDLRTPPEIAVGYLKNAIFLDFMVPGFSTKIAQLDKSKSYLVYCQSGYRSEKTYALMRSEGFRNVYEMSGGFGRWFAAGLPFEK